MMVHWLWIVAAVLLGGFAGMFAVALCCAAGRADEQAELMAARKELEVMKRELRKGLGAEDSRMGGGNR